jgi:hypothetical protein
MATPSPRSQRDGFACANRTASTSQQARTPRSSSRSPSPSTRSPPATEPTRHRAAASREGSTASSPIKGDARAAPIRCNPAADQCCPDSRSALLVSRPTASPAPGERRYCWSSTDAGATREPIVRRRTSGSARRIGRGGPAWPELPHDRKLRPQRPVPPRRRPRCRGRRSRRGRKCQATTTGGSPRPIAEHRSRRGCRR